MSDPAQSQLSGEFLPAPTRVAAARLDRLFSRQPPGLSQASAMAWRALAMARDGYGWEDIVVASRGWDGGPLSEGRARELVADVHGARRSRSDG